MKKQFSVDDVRAMAKEMLDNNDKYSCQFCGTWSYFEDITHENDCIVHTAKRLLEECEK